MDINNRVNHNAIVASAIVNEMETMYILLSKDDEVSMKTVMANLMGLLVEENFPQDVSKSKQVITANYKEVHRFLDLIRLRLVNKEILNKGLVREVAAEDIALGFKLLNKYLTEDILIYIGNKINSKN